MLDRRVFLSGALAVAAARPGSRDAALKALLDELGGRIKDPAAMPVAAEALDRFGGGGLSPARRLEWALVREGLRREAAAGGGFERALELACGARVDPLALEQRATIAARLAQDRAGVLLDRQGLAGRSVADRLGELMRDPRWLYPDDEAARALAVADMTARLFALRPRLADAFGTLPMPPVEVKRAPAGRAGYREPGAYFVDLADIRARPSWTLPSVAYHELLPGHLLQLQLQRAADPHPLRLRYAGAFSEGWAAYAEALAAALGAYEADPLGEIGFLHWRLFRLARAITDVRLGARGWSRERAAEGLHAIQGPSIAFVTVEADVERIAARPGQSAAEALTLLTLERLRPPGEPDWPAYHRAVLSSGPWPPALLSAAIRCCSAG